ncbi:MAG: MFS transporter, partial [Clostridia bacterium]|nr:MFS transporter [Clostridia bacterium]
LYSIGGGLTEVVISPIVDALPGDAKASAMSLLHAFYSWGQVLVVILTTVVLALIGDDNWRWIPLGWAMIPFFNLFNFMRVPIVEVSEEQKSNGIGTFMKSPIFIVALLMMICGGASEQAMAQWASLFAERALGVSKITGDLLGPCLFALCMGIGRTGYGIFGEKINIEKALLGCAGLSVVCYLVTVFVPVPVFSLLGCAFCGFGVSLMWPGILSYTSQKYNYNAGPVLFSLLALGGDTGCSLGPWVTGVVSDLYLTVSGTGADAESQAIRYGILAAIVFPLVMLVLLAVMRKLRSHTGEKNAAED